MNGEIEELVTALQLDEHDIVMDMVLVARVANPARPASIISMSATDDVDFSRQLGMLHEAILVMERVSMQDREP